jgi:hypothetical protein
MKISSSQRLFEIAESQEGLFTAKQAEAAGFDKRNHSYHVKRSHWKREGRGIYRLAQFPISTHSAYVLWSLWSKNRKGEPEGIYSHQTTLSIFDLSDIMPSKIHMTVPPRFRRSGQMPCGLVLHRHRIPRSDYMLMHGFKVQKPLPAIVALLNEEVSSEEILAQALSEGVSRGLITRAEIVDSALPAETRLKFQLWISGHST